MNEITIEQHPLTPFLPPNARVLMLGSFPPQPKRWAMNFYYPNWNNDMWRIMGLVFFNNKDYFVDTGHKTFRQPDIAAFLEEKGIAIFDTATAIRRLQDNASDKFLEIVQPTDIKALLTAIPLCGALITTGQKATDTLIEEYNFPEPRIGSFSDCIINNRPMKLYRMPSSSRAYPLALSKKAEIYKNMFHELQMI